MSELKLLCVYSNYSSPFSPDVGCTINKIYRANKPKGTMYYEIIETGYFLFQKHFIDVTNLSDNIIALLRS